MFRRRCMFAGAAVYGLFADEQARIAKAGCRWESDCEGQGIPGGCGIGRSTLGLPKSPKSLVIKMPPP